MLVKIGQKFEVWIRKALPDPLVIAIILTLIVGLLADIIAANRKLLEDVQYHVRRLDYDKSNNAEKEQLAKENT